MSKAPDPIPLLAEIEAFLNERGMAATTFGVHAVGNWKLVSNLRAGGDVTTRNAEAIRKFMASPEARAIRPRRRVA